MELQLLILVGFITLCSGLAPGSLQVVTGLPSIILYDQQVATNPIKHFDGLTIFWYNSATSLTLFQSNQWTINLGTASSVYNFLPNTPTPSVVNDLEENLSYPHRFDTCGAWLVGLEYNVMGDGKWLAFYHGENRYGFDPDCNYPAGSAQSYKAMGLAVSSGSTPIFSIDKSAGNYSNAIITSPNAPTGYAGDGVYFQSSQRPGYRYILYTQDSKTCIAKAETSCLNQSWCWHKYYTGTWNAAGLGGNCDNISPFQAGAARYVAEIYHSAENRNYLMAVEVTQYGGALLYFTDAFYPEGPWTQYGASVLYHSGFRNPTNLVSASIIYTTVPGAGNSKVINEGEQFVIAYTLSFTNMASEGAPGSESLVVYQPVTLYGNPTSWTGTVLNPIRTFFITFSSILYSWTTNLIYSPAGTTWAESPELIGYMPTFTNVIGYSSSSYVLLYTCYFSVTVGSNAAVMITDVRYTTSLPNIETRPPDGSTAYPGAAVCPGGATSSQYVGFAMTSQNSAYAMQRIYLCQMAAETYSSTFHYLSNAANCNNYGLQVTTSPAQLWIFSTPTGH